MGLQTYGPPFLANVYTCFQEKTIQCVFQCICIVSIKNWTRATSAIVQASMDTMQCFIVCCEENKKLLLSGNRNGCCYHLPLNPLQSGTFFQGRAMRSCMAWSRREKREHQRNSFKMLNGTNHKALQILHCNKKTHLLPLMCITHFSPKMIFMTYRRIVHKVCTSPMARLMGWPLLTKKIINLQLEVEDATHIIVFILKRGIQWYV